MSDLTEFSRQLDALALQVPRKHRDAQARIVAKAYENAVEISPVLSGAYVNEHVVEVGSGDQVSALLLESPDRVGPDEEIEPGTLDRPSVGGVAVLGEFQPFQAVQIANRRFYVNDVEDRHAVFSRIAAAAEVEAESIEIILDAP